VAGIVLAQLVFGVVALIALLLNFRGSDRLLLVSFSGFLAMGIIAYFVYRIPSP
jgi:hypothetical protein